MYSGIQSKIEKNSKRINEHTKILGSLELIGFWKGNTDRTLKWTEKFYVTKWNGEIGIKELDFFCLKIYTEYPEISLFCQIRL